MWLQASVFVWHRFNLSADIRLRNVTERSVISSTTCPEGAVWRKSTLTTNGVKRDNTATWEPRESEVRGSRVVLTAWNS